MGLTLCRGTFEDEWDGRKNPRSDETLDTSPTCVSAFITSLVSDFSIRDDILQNTAVAVLDSFDRYDPERPFISWALGIAHNQVRLYFRQQQRQKLIFDEECVTQLAVSFESLDDSAKQGLAYLHDCLQRLEGRAKQLCELRYIQGLKPALISEQFGMSVNGVAKALQRIREQLRACIQEKLTLENGDF